MKVSCIIPALNEQKTIGYTIDILKLVKQIDEIIVVASGTDDTYGIAKSKNVKVISCEPKGKGYAVKQGIRESTGDVLFFMDADFTSIKPRLIEKMLMISRNEELDADIVIGVYKFNTFQKFTEIIYKPLMSLFFPEVAEIINKGHLSGQRAVKRDIIEKINLRDDFGFETAMNIELCMLNPLPNVIFAELEDLQPVIKGRQERMDVIANTIIEYAKKYNRLDRLDENFVSISKVLHETVEKALH